MEEKTIFPRRRRVRKAFRNEVRMHRVKHDDWIYHSELYNKYFVPFGSEPVDITLPNFIYEVDLARKLYPYDYLIVFENSVFRYDVRPGRYVIFLRPDNTIKEIKRF